jgi:DNA (cytosine-5)-methyltransferase 1
MSESHMKVACARLPNLTAIDLFSGCGGLTLGLKRAGFNVIGAVEIDPVAVETYRANHPDVVVWDRNIRQLHVADVRRRLGIRKGELDLVAGCPPCEGFSTLRTLNGGRTVSDPRNELIFQFLRFVRQLRPRAVMLENVPGLGNDARFAQFCTALRRMHYRLDYRVFNAADYGVPQRRRRLIVIAGRFDPITFAKTDPARQSVRDVIGSLPPSGSSGDPLHDLPELRSERVRTMISSVPRDGGSRSAVPADRRLACHVRCNGFKDVYGRMSWDAVAPTITGGCFNPSKGRFLHPDEDRCITMREAALLQGFPLDYAFSLKRGKTHAATLIGNAIPPEFIARHAMKVAECLTLQGKHERRSTTA